MPKDLFNDTLKKTNTGLTIIAELMEELQKRANNREIGYKDAEDLYTHYEKNGQSSCYAWPCDPSVVKDLDKKLTEAGITHACLQGPNKNILFVAKDADREKVNAVKNALLKEMRTMSKVSLDELRRENIDSNLHSIHNVSPTYAGVFQEEAKKAGFLVAITDNKNGTFDLYYSEKDANKAKPVLMKAVESTRGVTGQLNELRIAENARVNQELYDNISDHQREFYIVSPYNRDEYMHFTPERYQYYLNGKLIEDELRNNNNFQQDAHNRVDRSFSRPVILARDEFERVRELPENNYKEEIKKKYISSKTHTLSTRDTRRLELERMAHQLAEYKMSIDNNSLNNNFYDSSVSFSGFVAQEVITDERIDRASDRDIAENTSNRESLPPEIQNLVEEYDKLPYEERIYVDEITKECLDDLNDIETKIEIEEVTREDLSEQDIDALIAGLAEERTTTTERTEYETERTF